MRFTAVFDSSLTSSLLKSDLRGQRLICPTENLAERGPPLIQVISYKCVCIYIYRERATEFPHHSILCTGWFSWLIWIKTSSRNIKCRAQFIYIYAYYIYIYIYIYQNQCNQLYTDHGPCPIIESINPRTSTKGQGNFEVRQNLPMLGLGKDSLRLA